jgi:hypothetical protein
MSAGRRSVLLVMALVGSVAAAPVHADPTAAPVLSQLVRSGGLPSGTTSLIDGQVISTRTVTDILASPGRHTDAGVWLRSVAAATALLDEQNTGRAPIVVGSDEAEPVEGGPVEFGPFAAAGPGGDLDGDGLEDVLSLVAEKSQVQLQARRGTDGASLWSVEYVDSLAAFAYPVGRDLTGDGVDDLVLEGLRFSLVVEDEGTSGPLEETQTARFKTDLETTFGVVSGADGQPVWTRTVPGTLDQSSTDRSRAAGAVEDGEYTMRSTAIAVLPLVSDDVTGDGLADLAVTTLDLDLDAHSTRVGTSTAGATRVTAALRGSATGEVVEGDSGTTSSQRRVTGRPGVPLLLPVGQVVGSDVADFAWLTHEFQNYDGVCARAVFVGECVPPDEDEPEIVIELLDGQAGEAVWRRATPGFNALITRIGSDLDGDGTGDLAVEVLDETTPSRLEIVSGARGTELWRAEGTDSVPRLLGVGDSETGLFVAVGALVATGEDDLVSGEYTLRIEALIERRSAATGAVLSSTRHVATAAAPTGDGGAGGSSALTLTSADDGDGDGKREIVVSVAAEATSFDADGNPTSSSAQSTSVVESLDGGRTLLSEPSEDVRFLETLGDVDGDGLLDLRRNVVTAGDVSISPVVDAAAFRAVDGAPLWRLQGGLFELPFVAGDQDGAPGHELLQVRHSDGPPQVLSLRGQDLTVRWSAPA